jgi:hypothetical protein
MRIAAGPAGGTDVKFVQLLVQKFASDRDKIRLHLVSTAGPKESAEAIANDGADLAILPSTIGNSLDWPVVASVRQNVMALIVPAAPVSATVKKEPTPPAKKEEAAAPEKKKKPAKGAKKAKVAAKNGDKSAKSDKGAKNAKAAKNGDKSTDKNADKDEDADAGDDSSKTTDTTDADSANKLDKITKLAGHRVGIVTGSVATKDLLDTVLNHYGVPPGRCRFR